MRAPKYEIVRTTVKAIVGKDRQDWHVRLVGGNGKNVMTGENLTSKRSALNAIRVDANCVPLLYTTPLGHGLIGHVTVNGQKRQIIFLDERERA